MDRIVDQILTLLTASVKTPRGIKQIYKGDIVMIPRASIPAIVIDAKGTDIKTQTTFQDVDEYSIDIVVILDARDYFNASATVMTGKEFLTKIMEERISGTSNELKSDTILKTIRSGFDSSSDFTLRADPNINYIFNTNREFPTIEAVLSVRAISKIYAR